MKVNAINNKINISRPTFKGFGSDPGLHAVKSQMVAAGDAEKFIQAMIAAKKQDAASTNFMSAFINKIVLAGEILGFKNLKQAGSIMNTPEHKEIVKRLDKGVDAMLNATGYSVNNALNVVA